MSEVGRVISRPEGKTATRNALEILEILERVFQYEDKATLASCARVCQAWSSVALDALWTNLPSIVPILELISPLICHPEWRGKRNTIAAYWEFLQPIESVSWERFRSYSARVKRLCFDDSRSIKRQANPLLPFGSIQSAVYYHPFGPSLLPNLQVLDFSISLDDHALLILPFTTPAMETLRLRLRSGVGTDAAGRLFRNLWHRTPKLQTFNFTYDNGPVNFENQLSQWLSMLPDLRTISLPRFYQTQKIIISLSNLRSLTNIKSVPSLERGYDEAGMSFEASPETFKYLTNLSLDASFAKAAGVFSVSSRLSQLKGLQIHNPRFHDSSHITKFILAPCCPSLSKLVLNLFSDASASSIALSWFDIQRLKALQALDTLEIYQDHPLYLTEGNVVEIGAAWPSLMHLHLCHDPLAAKISIAQASNDVTSIFVLRQFAKSLPNLRSLSLYLSTSGVLPFNGDLEPPAQFRKLEHLGVGLSDVAAEKVNDIAFFLASLCRSIPSISYDPSPWCTQRRSGEDEDARVKRWGDVEKLFRMLLQTKRIYQQQRVNPGYRNDAF